MKTLEDVLQKLEEMDVDTDEIKISRAIFNFFVEKAEEILSAEEEKEEEED